MQNISTNLNPPIAYKEVIEKQTFRECQDQKEAKGRQGRPGGGRGEACVRVYISLGAPKGIRLCWEYFAAESQTVGGGS